jgi:hypothetical protein
MTDQSTSAMRQSRPRDPDTGRFARLRRMTDPEGAFSAMVKSAITNSHQDEADIMPAELVPTEVVRHYPDWIDTFEDQVRQLVQAARQGNRVAFQLLADLQHTCLTRRAEAVNVNAIMIDPGGTDE